MAAKQITDSTIQRPVLWQLLAFSAAISNQNVFSTAFLPLVRMQSLGSASP